MTRRQVGVPSRCAAPRRAAPWVRRGGWSSSISQICFSNVTSLRPPFLLLHLAVHLLSFGNLLNFIYLSKIIFIYLFIYLFIHLSILLSSLFLRGGGGGGTILDEIEETECCVQVLYRKIQSLRPCQNSKARLRFLYLQDKWATPVVKINCMESILHMK